MPNRLSTFCVLLLVGSSFFSQLSAVGQAPDATGAAFFEQKIRPVLVQQCYSCHSEVAREDKKLKGELYLDSQEGILTGGESGPAIVKGKPAESLLIKAMKFDGLEMPPSGKLSNDVIADFEKWVSMGAPDPRHGKKPTPAKREIDIAEGKKFWSFQPLKKIEPPAVSNSALVKTPIDRFIVAKQAEYKLKPNKLAAPEKLIRRAYFDLIGLPPTPEQVAAFVQDPSPQAFEKVVDSLLESEHYGERWARHWLDVVRFAESGGYEFDGFRPGAFHYRDWVIKALNRDMPYDEFIRMQLAGDKLLPDDYQGAAATGFLVAGPYPGQITQKTEERIRYDQIDDMMMTIGGSMLGLTLGCVRCHEHKYDPIPAKDYYGLAASLAKTVHGARTYDPDPAASQQALEKHQQAREPLLDAIRNFAKEQLSKRFDPWQKNELPKQPDAPRWQVLEPITAQAERSWLKITDSGVIAHDGNVTSNGSGKGRRRGRQVQDSEEYTISVHTFQKNIAALRLDTFTDKSLPKRGPGLNADGSFQLLEMKVTAKPLSATAKDAPLELKFGSIVGALEDKDQPAKNAVDGKPATGWVVKTSAGKDNAAIFEIEGGLAGFAEGTELTFELKFRDAGMGRVRFSLSTEPNPSTWAGDFVPQHLGEIRAILATNKNKIPDYARESMVRWFSRFDGDTAKVLEPLVQHDRREPRPALTDVYTTINGGRDVYMLRRGEVDNKQGKADPSFIQVLSNAETETERWLPKPASGQLAVDPRIGLAHWMTDVEHGAGALVARVMANRLWQHHLGEGIVGTPNDFGVQGERPTHPELLDYLASELVNSGWKLKPLHRLIMLSGVYQQSHEVSAENLKIDPENRYVWHYRPRRLDAEIIRDSLLMVGGSLDKKMYGPSILDNVSRRSIYLRVKRSELIPLMTMFDAPEPTQSIGERVSTTVPTQALAMMNSPFVRQQAERLAQRIRSTKDAPMSEVIDRAYQIAFARTPSTAERERMLAFLGPPNANSANDAAQLPVPESTLTEFCHVLLCLNEFVYID